MLGVGILPGGCCILPRLHRMPWCFILCTPLGLCAMPIMLIVQPRNTLSCLFLFSPILLHSQVDRSGAYIARQAAKSVVAAGLARRCLVQVRVVSV